MAFNPKDYYFKKAKKNNYAARSIFKLEEIDSKFKLLKKGNRVLDLGAAPGSWSQYCSKVVGDTGVVLGIDLKEISLNLKNVYFLKENILEVDYKEVESKSGIKPPFDVVLSDMAPKTTGIKTTDQERSKELCQKALKISREVLNVNGHFICKLFHSEGFEELKKEMLKSFDRVKAIRPKSTRKQSTEIFLVGIKFKN